MTGKIWKLLAIALLLSCELSLLAPATPTSAQDGTATWYGPGFHGRRMANGQVFDMYDPTTVACNAYPLGTWLKVTNRANGRSIIVQVRDRGAFGHLLDLSYAAYMALGGGPSPMLVSVEVASGPEEQEATPVPTPTPTPQPTPTATPEPVVEEHVVQPGETLWDIAIKYNLTVEELASLNGIEDVNMVGEGDRLRVSSRSSRYDDSSQSSGGQSYVSSDEGESTSEPASQSSAPGYYHVVQAGETLSSIAADYGLTVEELAQLNQIDDPESLAEGQALYVFRQHEVQEGDTLGGIALQYGVSLEDLMAINGLQEGDFIQPGAILIIPN